MFPLSLLFYYTVATPEETLANKVAGDGAEDDEERPDLR